MQNIFRVVLIVLLVIVIIVFFRLRKKIEDIGRQTFRKDGSVKDDDDADTESPDMQNSQPSSQQQEKDEK